MSIILYILPSLILIFGLYIFMFAGTLQTFLGLSKKKNIHTIAATYILLSIVGFLLMANSLEIATYIWMFLVIVLSSLVSASVYFLLKNRM